MDRATQTALLKRLLTYVETKTTAMADAPWRNEVAAYNAPDRIAREQEHLFRKRPVFMGLSCDWAKPGTYRTDDFAGVPVLVVRGRDGQLRAFLNVCRHRGAKVAQGSGHAMVFACPYHSWTYDVQGALRGIPDEGSFPGVRAERGGLTPLPLAEKYGMVWVIPTAAEDVSKHAASTFDIDPMRICFSVSVKNLVATSNARCLLLTLSLSTTKPQYKFKTLTTMSITCERKDS